MKSENVQRFGVLRRLRLLGGLNAGLAILAGGFPSLASAQEAMGNTGCFWYENADGKQGSKVTGIQCPFTSSFGGNPQDSSEAGPIPLITSTGLLKELNDWLADNNIGSSIQQSSFVGIETLGGKGRNGDSCGACSSGQGAGGGYAITVQQLGGMQGLIQEFGGYVNETTPPVLFGFVGREGLSPGNGSHRGGGGGAGSWVTGKHPLKLEVDEVLFPSAQTNATDNTTGTDDLVFAIGGGGGGGGGVQVSGSGKHGGSGGRMNGTGPDNTEDSTVKGEGGDGTNSGKGGSSSGDGIGGAGGGNGNNGISGIGGMGGLDSNHAGFIGTAFTWGAGLGGAEGGTVAAGGGGGGGWGGGGGGGENGNSTGGTQGHGGAGGGSWARNSVSTATSLPTLYNLHGSGFSLSDAGFSQIVISFSVVPNNTTALPASSDTTLLRDEPNRNIGDALRLAVGSRRADEFVVHFAGDDLEDFLAGGELRSAILRLRLAERGSPRSLEIVPIPGGFVESEATWNCADGGVRGLCLQWPDSRFAKGEIRKPDQKDMHTKLIGFDVTKDVKAGISTWLIRSPEHGASSNTYYSREGALAASRPQFAPTLLLERE